MNESWNAISERHAMGRFLDRLALMILKCRGRPAPQVLVFHRMLRDYDSRVWGSSFPIDAFARLLDALPRAGLRGITLSDMAARYADGGLRACKNCIGLSFDDGAADVFEAAFPLLQAHGVKATVFVTTSLIGAKGPPQPWTLEDGTIRGLTEDQIRTLARAGIEIASHGVNHFRLSSLPSGRRMDELIASKACLEAVTGVPVRAFGYPHGDWNSTLADEVRHAGYSSGWTCEPRALGKRESIHALPRLSAHPNRARDPDGIIYGAHLAATLRRLAKGRASA